MKTSSVKAKTSPKPAGLASSDKPQSDRATFAAFYIFIGTLLLSLLYFLSLVFFF